MNPFPIPSPGGVPLFDRIDLVPLPESPRLASLLARWRACRGEGCAPACRDFGRNTLESCGPGVFFCDVVDGGRDYHVRYDREGLTALIARLKVGDMLSQSAVSPAAARLHRLFDLVVRRTNPLCGAFDLGEGQVQRYVEVLVAPLTDEKRCIVALVGAIAGRRESLDRPMPGRRPGVATPLTG